jgi:serine/threonine-protein kinase
MECPGCQAEVLDIDVRCPKCGRALGATGAHKMLGTTVLGHYQLVDVLGQGGMSVVFKGKHEMTDQEVALKILPPELAANSQVKGRFLEEAKALAALDHPNIVHLYNFGQENGCFVLAMQYVQGVTWERMILENERLDWKTSCKITCDVLRALEYAHGRGIVHRDMKPSNVLVRGLDGSATVMDFGIAKMTTSTRLTATGQTMGTVRYMSPEQVRGQDVDLRTDLYSLGATLYESLTGDTPFDGSTHFEIMTKHLSEPPKRPSQLGIEVPALVEDALMRALSKRAEDRFDSARDWRKIIEAALREGDVGLLETQKVDRALLEGGKRKPATTPPPTKPSAATPLAEALEPSDTGHYKRKSKLPWLVLAGVVLAGGGAAAFLLKGKSKPKTETYQPHVVLDGTTIVAGERIGKRLIETDGSVTSKELAQAFDAALAELRAYKPATGSAPAVEIPELVFDEIVAVSRDTFCSPKLYEAYPNGKPADCRAAGGSIALGAGGSRLMVIVGDRPRLAASMRDGLVQVVCRFQSDDAFSTAACTRAEEWAKSGSK